MPWVKYCQVKGIFHVRNKLGLINSIGNMMFISTKINFEMSIVVKKGQGYVEELIMGPNDISWEFIYIYKFVLFERQIILV